VARLADGVVVGSALVDSMAAAVTAGGDHEAAMAAALVLLADIRQGIDSTAS
jgi:tryptophan synthase alpha subunit